jgi:hypothetical protein
MLTQFDVWSNVIGKTAADLELSDRGRNYPRRSITAIVAERKDPLNERVVGH